MGCSVVEVFMLSKKIQRFIISLVDARIRAFATFAIASAFALDSLISQRGEAKGGILRYVLLKDLNALALLRALTARIWIYGLKYSFLLKWTPNYLNGSGLIFIFINPSINKIGEIGES
ncbi:hypothetical protein SS1G_01040 [Sclerotinia sclerotiorum 1980 UF-70]|uniref:Uncharacterized protein n=1 Tax=Sclerotinia sclerotiorum (strain ATCC 18683 / 1980 / Ss-1) TaxID=665079 RepID=A7E6W4_SCLS1|nr:hypothetical protein SS1G_01040 [Sclerotinia sclerotiorum 1980 UF-70]EDN91636.1 hypothetical protein SS1G_01040 [Sclerotinia sclerotiorum 1980 UF-70]